MKAKLLAIKVLVRIFGIVMPRRSVSASDPGRILIVTTTGIGDTLWGTPAIAALRKKHPNGYLCVLTNPAGAEILKANPAIDEIFVFRRAARGFLNFMSLVKSLRERRFGIVYIFHASDRIIWPISFLTGAPEIVGIGGQCKGLDFILTKAVSPRDGIHGIEARFDLIGLPCRGKSHETLSLYLSDKDREEAKAFLRSRGIGSGDLLIGLHPGAQKPFKCWPAKYFIEAGRSVQQKTGCRIIITGDKEERALAEQVACMIKGAVSSAGSLSLRGTAALIERMSLFITNDTGPMHLAFALKTPAVALFSPTDPELCGPYGAVNSVVINKPTICSPCKLKQCGNPLCLENIRPQEVIIAAEALLRGSKIQ
jgi:lipopolysaccharide heptosyltransferase II